MPTHKTQSGIPEFYSGRIKTGILRNHTDGGDGVSGLTGHPAWNKGKKGIYKHSEETCRRISEANKGQPPTYGMLGKKHSKEGKRKIALATSVAKKGKPWSVTKRAKFDANRHIQAEI